LSKTGKDSINSLIYDVFFTLSIAEVKTLYLVVEKTFPHNKKNQFYWQPLFT